MTAANVAPVTDATEWLTRLYEGCDGWLTLFSVDRSTGEQHVDWAPIEDAAKLAIQAEARAMTCCVWFGVATRKERLDRGRGGGSDCFQIPALWVDIDVEGPNHKGGHALPPDIEAGVELIHDFPLRPTALVRSGGGIQGWWFLREPMVADEQAIEFLRSWGATWAELARRRGWHVDNVFDVARIMRLPGTWNRKNVPVEVTAKASWTRRYDPEDFEARLLEPPAPPDPAPARIPYIGPARPGDAFNAVRNGQEVLSRAGFRHHRQRGDEDDWTHPYKDPREGGSATVYADGHTTIWSDTVQGHFPAVELRRPYDPFGLYTVLFHAGDWRSASDQLEFEGYGTKARAHDDLSWVPSYAWPKKDGGDEPEDEVDEGEGNPPDPYLARAVLLERARRQARRIVDAEEQATPEVDLRVKEPDPDIHQLFLQPEPEYRWLVEGLLERSDRLILTGPEGGGKSTLLRQAAVMAAAGLHPFTEDEIDPMKVLYVDLENSRRHTLRQLVPLVALADRRIAGGHLVPIIRPEGLDLMGAEDRQWLIQRVDANEPDLVVIGPLYKLALGDPTSEEVARHVAFTLDHIRAVYDVAFLIEAHQPHKNNGQRPERPYGASLWLRWPEFGLALMGGYLKHWRGARDERDWPSALRRGGTWPWTLASAAEAKFIDLVTACRDAGEILSHRDLVKSTGIPKTTVQRAIEANRSQWNSLVEELESEVPE